MQVSGGPLGKSYHKGAWSNLVLTCSEVDHKKCESKADAILHFPQGLNPREFSLWSLEGPILKHLLTVWLGWVKTSKGESLSEPYTQCWESFFYSKQNPTKIKPLNTRHCRRSQLTMTRSHGRSSTLGINKISSRCSLGLQHISPSPEYGGRETQKCFWALYMCYNTQFSQLCEIILSSPFNK